MTIVDLQVCDFAIRLISMAYTSQEKHYYNLKYNKKA